MQQKCLVLVQCESMAVDPTECMSNGLNGSLRYRRCWQVYALTEESRAIAWLTIPSEVRVEIPASAQHGTMTPELC